MSEMIRGEGKTNNKKYTPISAPKKTNETKNHVTKIKEATPVSNEKYVPKESVNPAIIQYCSYCGEGIEEKQTDCSGCLHQTRIIFLNNTAFP